MNTHTFSSKHRTTRILIGTGFLALLACLAWAAIQLVAVVPSAFSSLASLADGISQYRTAVVKSEPLQITSSYSSLESGVAATLTWNKDERPGTYLLSYGCAPDVTISIATPEGERDVACDTRYKLGDTNSVTLTPRSLASTSVDISYAISFMRDNDIGPIRIAEQTLAITPPATLAKEGVTDGEVLGETTTQEDVASEPQTPAPVVVASPEAELVYKIPVSDPNGFADLSARFIGSGSIVGNKFVAETIKRNDNGAIQFEVKNIGTKTSESWSYTITLPDGDVYTSPRQSALKPNERAIITIGFSTPNKASHTFSVTVKVDDRNSNNNTFKRTVSFTN